MYDNSDFSDDNRLLQDEVMSYEFFSPSSTHCEPSNCVSFFDLHRLDVDIDSVVSRFERDISQLLDLFLKDYRLGLSNSFLKGEFLPNPKEMAWNVFYDVVYKMKEDL